MAFFLRTAFAARIATQSTKSSSIPRLQQLPAFRTGNSVRFYRPSQPLVQQKPPVTYYRFGGNNSNNSSGGKRSGFGGTGNVFQRWTARPTFYYEVGGIGLVAGGFYVYNLEPVPVSGRRRFNVISPKYERQMGEETYNQVIEQYRGRILPQNHSDVLLVKRVLARLLSGLAKLEASDETDQSPHNAAVSAGGAGGGWREGLDGWEVNVIRGEEANAFVLPGNKVFVFTGILPLMQDDSGVASVLSHEIAHNIAHHAAERMSNTVAIYYPFIAIVSVFLFISGADFGATNWLLRTVVDVGLEKPGSRRQESEADYIGLMLMARSCYDPARTLEFWERMRKAGKGNIPQFISTHPSDQTRITQITEWLPKARIAYEESECSTTKSHGMLIWSIQDEKNLHQA